MQYLIGFVIAMFIALTGVGAGTLTVPVLVLFLNVPAPAAVAIGLTFSAAVKLVLGICCWADYRAFCSVPWP